MSFIPLDVSNCVRDLVRQNETRELTLALGGTLALVLVTLAAPIFRVEPRGAALRSLVKQGRRVAVILHSGGQDGHCEMCRGGRPKCRPRRRILDRILTSPPSR